MTLSVPGTIGVIAFLAASVTAQRQAETEEARWRRHTSGELTLELPATWKPIALSDADWAKTRAELDPRLVVLLDDPKAREGFLWMAYDPASLRGRFVTSMNVKRRSFAKLDRATFESHGFRGAVVKSVRDQFAKSGVENVDIDEQPLAKGVLSLTIETSSNAPDEAAKSLTVQHVLLRYPNLWFLSFTSDATSADALRKLSRRIALSFREPDIEIEKRKFSFGTLALPKGWVAIELEGPDFRAERQRIADSYPELVTKAIDELKEKSKANLFAFAPETVKTSVIETANLRRQRVASLTETRVTDRSFLRRFEAELRRGLTDAGMLVQATSRSPFGERRAGLSIDYELRTHAGLIHGRQYVLFDPPHAWFLTFATSNDRATPPRLDAFRRCAESFLR